MLYLFWALVGWCGTPWPRRWPWPPPPPPPDGDPWFTKLINVIGGIVGGWLFERIWPMGANVTGIGVAATAVGALIGAIVLGDIVGMARAPRKA